MNALTKDIRTVVVDVTRRKARRFLFLLDPQAKAFTFLTFDDRRNADPKLVKVLHGSLDQHLPELIRVNKAGAGIFVAVNETDLKGRTSEHILRVCAVWQDDDGGYRGEYPLARSNFGSERSEPCEAMRPPLTTKLCQASARHRQVCKGATAEMSQSRQLIAVQSSSTLRTDRQDGDDASLAQCQDLTLAAQQRTSTGCKRALKREYLERRAPIGLCQGDHVNTPVFETPRLVLRPVTLRDAGAIQSILPTGT
jgi:hypothetical protein